MIVSEIRKQINILGTKENVFFYRDSNRREVDLIIDKALTQIPIEIKSSGSYSKNFSE
jgi:predicted AAA+ superfamily ATPase